MITGSGNSSGNIAIFTSPALGTGLTIGSNGNVSIGSSTISSGLQIDNPEKESILCDFHDLIFEILKEFNGKVEGWLYRISKSFESLNSRSSFLDITENIKKVYEDIEEVNCSRDNRIKMGDLIDRMIEISWFYSFDFERVEFEPL